MPCLADEGPDTALLKALGDEAHVQDAYTLHVGAAVSAERQ